MIKLWTCFITFLNLFHPWPFPPVLSSFPRFILFPRFIPFSEFYPFFRVLSFFPRFIPFSALYPFLPRFIPFSASEIPEFRIRVLSQPIRNVVYYGHNLGIINGGALRILKILEILKISRISQVTAIGLVENHQTYDLNIAFIIPNLN